MRYTIKEVSEELLISKDALIDVRNMLRIKKINDNNYKRVKNVVRDIERRYGRCTLSTINRYKLWCD